MDSKLAELHETVIRLAKGIVTARERWERANPGRPLAETPLHAGQLSVLLEERTSALKATIGVWEDGLARERTRPA